MTGREVLEKLKQEHSGKDTGCDSQGEFSWCKSCLGAWPCVQGRLIAALEEALRQISVLRPEGQSLIASAVVLKMLEESPA